MKPTPRYGVYDLYWQFAAKRQAIFEQRLQGSLPPWTDDPILQTYKFCNVYRAADRVSQYLIRSVIYTDEQVEPADKIFQIVMFRTYSKIETWDALLRKLGASPKLKDLESGRLKQAFDEIKTEQGGLYTSAFILCANKAFGHDEKHHNYIGLFKQMFLEDNAAQKILHIESLEVLVKYLQSFPLIGPFMAYQIAIDLNYADFVGFDEDDYTQAGPGAQRGIAKAFTDKSGLTDAEIIQWMVKNQAHEFARLGLEFKRLFGRPLKAIDCQNLFCEFDKYCRVARPELASNRSRIKAKFVENTQPIPYFFPPKWNLN